jgi:hypothetical protein
VQVSVHFLNFIPTQWDLEAVDRHLESLQAHIPAESSGLARFRREHGWFYGFVEVISVRCEFAASARDEDFRRLLDRLQVELQRQVEAWQTQRSQDPQRESRRAWYSEEQLVYRNIFDSTPRRNASG